MPKFRIECTATATIREVWEIEAETEHAAIALLHGSGTQDVSSSMTLIKDSIQGDERDREITRIEEISFVRLQFHPQAWQNKYAIPVDAEGETVWGMEKTYFHRHFPTRQSFSEADEKRDDLHYADEAPDWVQTWSGPFEVSLAPGEDPWGDEE